MIAKLLVNLPVLHFRVKFWVTNPGKLAEEYTRYQMVLQLRKDICSGLLPTPTSTATLLASYVLQAELGDYNVNEHNTKYISQFRLIPNQTSDIVKKIGDLHKLHR